MTFWTTSLLWPYIHYLHIPATFHQFCHATARWKLSVLLLLHEYNNSTVKLHTYTLLADCKCYFYIKSLLTF